MEHDNLNYYTSVDHNQCLNKHGSSVVSSTTIAVKLFLIPKSPQERVSLRKQYPKHGHTPN